MAPRWQILLVTSVAVFMSFLDVTIVNVAFPDIRASFRGSSLSQLSWILNAYTIVFAAALVPAGRLADRFGRGDQCAVPDAARRHFAVVPTADKQLRWEGQTRHLQFYDDPAVIDRTVCGIVDWFARHVGPSASVGHA